MDTNETTIYTAVLTSVGVIGAILFYFAITILRSHRRYFKILRQHFLEEVELLEKERNRIAKDLHDELGPALMGIKFQLASLHDVTTEEQNKLESASKNIDTVSRRLGGIAKNLTPRLLLQKGFETTVTDFFEQYDEASTIKMKLRYDITSTVNNDIALQLFRMVQELVHNCVKHSEASELFVQLAERKKKIYLYYKDNGKGIPTEIRGKTEGLGLRSLRSRAEMLGGSIQCTTAKGKGTEYFFEIPLKRNHE